MLRLLISARLIYLLVLIISTLLERPVSEKQTAFQINAETMLGTITLLVLFPAFRIRRMAHPTFSFAAKVKSRSDD